MAVTVSSALGGDRNKVLALIGLVGVLVIAAWYSWGSSPAPPPKAASDTSDPRRVKNSDLASDKTPDAQEPSDAAGNGVLDVDFEPLNLGQVAEAPATLAVVRNPFAFTPPPPPPKPLPVVPPPPPTINVGRINPQNVVAGVPRGVAVSVFGDKFPVDAQIQWNGRPVQTTFVNENEVKANLTTGEISNPGMVKVTVVSASQPTRLWSGELTFQVIPSPTPPFKYVGRIGNRAIIDYGNERDGQQIVEVGTMLGTPAQWKVLAVTPEQVELLDVRNEIKKSITMAKKGR